MPSDLETYLAAVEEEDDVARAAQVHVPTLVEMLKQATLLARCDAGSDATKLITDKLHRIARDAMEKK